MFASGFLKGFKSILHQTYLDLKYSPYAISIVLFSLFNCCISKNQAFHSLLYNNDSGIFDISNFRLTFIIRRADDTFDTTVNGKWNQLI